jgi:glyoxalase family protein
VQGVNGVHHITAIAGPAQENLDFYAGVLGMRLVKRSVNQDDPTTYHLFYADAEGHPGSDLTFFPWAQMAPPRPGYGLAMEVGLEVPQGSLEYWGRRLEKYGTQPEAVQTRFGHRVLPFPDPHGLRVALVEAPAGRPFTPWEGSPVPGEQQIRGLHGAQIWERDATATKRFLTTVPGFEESRPKTAEFASGSGVRRCRGRPRRTQPGAAPGVWVVCTISAWRVDDETHQSCCGRGIVPPARSRCR